MRSVLYTDEFEPITVIDIPQFAVEYLERIGYVRLAVEMEPECTPFTGTFNPREYDKRMMIVEIVAEKIYRRGKMCMMLFTKNEEAALLLKSSFLPGQQREVNSIRREAFCKGFYEAFLKLGRGAL